jgi:hypothetical protein
MSIPMHALWWDTAHMELTSTFLRSFALADMLLLKESAIPTTPSNFGFLFVSCPP